MLTPTVILNAFTEKNYYTLNFRKFLNSNVDPLVSLTVLAYNNRHKIPIPCGIFMGSTRI